MNNQKLTENTDAPEATPQPDRCGWIQSIGAALPLSFQKWRPQRLPFLCMRLFIGVPLAAAVIDELRAVSARLRSSRNGLRWTAPESWHVTLQFLGNTGPEQYECVVARLRTLHSPPILVCLEELSCFERAGILIAGVLLTPELLLLQQHVTAATQPCGFVPETRPFQPHITLARSKGRHNLDQLKAKIRRPANFTRFTAREFFLYESFLSPDGARYEVRERFVLDGDHRFGSRSV
jgi:2'-5' RNA ligase